MKKLLKWFILFVFLLIATIVDWIIPDPVPFIDEFLLTGLSIWTGIKTIKNLFS